jgi:hypothetical protein
LESFAFKSAKLYGGCEPDALLSNAQPPTFTRLTPACIVTTLPVGIDRMGYEVPSLLSVVLFAEGHTARLRGESRAANPYEPTSTEWQLWDDGWSDS